MKEPLPLAKIQEAVLEFLRHRNDAMLFGAHAVNAYVDEPRMTQDVDVMSPRASELAEEIRAFLAKEFTIAARIREVAAGHGFRVYQFRQPTNRHLVDVRQVVDLPPNQLIADVRVPVPEELIAQKVAVFSARRGQPKSRADWRDLTLLLLAHPGLKVESGPGLARLVANSADEAAIEEWKKLVAIRITAEDDADDWTE